MRNGLKAPLIHPFSGWDVPRLVSAHAKARPDHPFLIWEPFNGPAQSWSYGAFEARITRIAAGLAVRGIGAGDRLLVHLDNCAEAVLIWYACAKLGAVPVTTNARSVADDLNYFAAHSGAVAAVTQPKFAALVNRACPDLKWIAVTQKDNGDDPAPGQAPAASDSFDAIDAEPDRLPVRAVDPMAPAGIQYTRMLIRIFPVFTSMWTWTENGSLSRTKPQKNIPVFYCPTLTKPSTGPLFARWHKS